jgi:hypothetical protein
MAVSLVGVPLAGEIKDFDDSGDVFPAYIAFEFLDASFTPVCFVLWDADALSSVSASSWPTDSGGALFNAWELNPTGGFTDCGEVDAGLFGDTDIRRWIASRGVWGFGLGEMTSTVSTELSVAVGADWSTDWQPYVFGSYVSLNGSALEMGYAFAYPQDCGVIDPALVPRSTPTSEVSALYVEALSFFVFGVDTLM